MLAHRLQAPLLPLNTLRRKATATLGIVGLLALPGAQAVLSPPLISSAQAVDYREGESYFYDASWPGSVVPQTEPGTVPVPGTAASPYGLTSSSQLTASGIPAAAYRAYVNAAADLARTDPRCGIAWSLIAGIGRVESNHGRFGGSSIGFDGVVSPPILGVRLDGSRTGTARIADSDGGRYDGDPVTDRAVGPMQFLPGTWKIYGDGGNPQDMNAAAVAAARYLCQGGASLSTQQGRWAAVYRYNHSDSYVSLVLSLADSYASGTVATFPTRPAGTPTVPDHAPSATVPGPPPSVPEGLFPVVTTPDPGRTGPTTRPTVPSPTSPTSQPTGTGTVTTSPTTPPSTAVTTDPVSPTATVTESPTTAPPPVTQDPPAPTDSPSPTGPVAPATTASVQP